MTFIGPPALGSNARSWVFTEDVKRVFELQMSYCKMLGCGIAHPVTATNYLLMMLGRLLVFSYNLAAFNQVGQQPLVPVDTFAVLPVFGIPLQHLPHE